MAKVSHDETSDVGRQSSQAPGGPSSQSAAREPFGGRDFHQAARDAQSAGRNVQSGMSEFLAATANSYSDLAREMESATRQWAQGMRASLEQTYTVGQRANEALIEQARRTTDFYLRLYETGASFQRSMFGDIQGRAQRPGNGNYRGAAE